MDEESVTIKVVIERLLRTRSATEWLEESHWVESSSPEEIDAHHRAYTKKFEKVLKEITTEIGEPRFVTPQNSEWFSQWYPEAFAAAAWEIDGIWLCLAAEHPDRETPIGLLVRSLTTQERDELAE